MSFKLPDSSFLPSTPNSRSLHSHPSTTPAVPPPDWLQQPSTTPAVPPPKSIFGSSYPAGGTFPRGTGSALKSFTLPESSPPRFEDKADEEEQQHVSLQETADAFMQHGGLLNSMMSSTRGLKRSRNGHPRPQRESTMPAIARGLMDHHKKPRLQESDELIIKTERVINALDSAAQHLDMRDPDEATTGAVQQLASIWQRDQPPESREGAIGPSSDSPVAEASYIASFLLSLHHPYSASPTPQSNSAGQRATSSTVPQALLSWLNLHHNPFVDEFDSVHLYQPSPAASESFWDVIYTSLLRGRFDRVIRLFKDAGWEHAVTALDDGAARPGYTGKQYQNTRESIDKCTRVLLSCPAVQHGNWDVKGPEWALFRHTVRSTLRELELFAEGSRDTASQQENMFSQSARGQQSLSSMSRRAESRIPWSIYDNLRTLYAHLQGSVEEIILVSQDWLEASVYSTVWWDGDDGNESTSKSSGRKGLQYSTREVDITPLRAYRQRLAESFALATTDPQDTVFVVDSRSIAQVGVACAMEDCAGVVIDILGSLSLPIATAVADIAALNEWLPEGRPRARGLVEQGFDEDDLLVLSQDHQVLQGDVDRDSLLASYADLLAQKAVLHCEDDGISSQGWEIAASVLGRMNDRQLADSKITALFDRINIKDDAEAQKLCTLCSDLGLHDQARRLSERYADGLGDGAQNYGAMLIFYARAHAFTKVADVLVLLTSLSLAQSAAMPPEHLLDAKMTSLLSADRFGLTELAEADTEAASNLSAQLSGYATLRQFYVLRDSNIQGSAPSKLKPIQRQQQAAKCLLAAIASASDSIRGGLFDASVESVVPTESLLVLLGEVLPLCGQSSQILSQAQVFTLLRVIEDLSACPARIRQAAEDFLKQCVSTSGPATLQKSQSTVSSTSGMGGSSYDLLATSSLILSQQGHEPAPIHRAWNWKSGLAGLNAMDINARSLLLLLRVALANELVQLSLKQNR